MRSFVVESSKVISLIQRLTAQKNLEKCFIKWSCGDSFCLCNQICSWFLGTNHDCSTLPHPSLSHCGSWNLIEVLKIVGVLSDLSWIIKHLQLECKLLFCWWWKNHGRIQFILIWTVVKKITWEKRMMRYLLEKFLKISQILF